MDQKVNYRIDHKKTEEHENTKEYTQEGLIKKLRAEILSLTFRIQRLEKLVIPCKCNNKIHESENLHDNILDK